MTEELSSLSSSGAQIKPPQRTNLHDIRNSDLVSRFLAATPPYLYSPPAGPHNYFFSEMLRSLVQAKTNEQNARNLSQLARRPRKRTWSRCMFDTTQTAPNLKELKEGTSVERSTIEKPLELTNKMTNSHFSIASLASKFPKDTSLKCGPRNDDIGKKENVTIEPNVTTEATNEPSTASIPPSDLVLPPPPPMWYPPLYPPYGIDPLHFFIDLRVSAAGHIYDRKKENVSPSSNENNNTTSSNSPKKLDSDDIGKHRLGSAFSVPQPRREKSPLALNLSSSTCATISDKNALIDYRNSLFLDAEKEALRNSKNPNYVLQNLPRIYTTMTPQTNDDRSSLISEDSDSKSESDLHDVDVKDEEGDFSQSDDVVIVDCQDSDGIAGDNNSKNNSY